jgi:hypothetical protein
MTLRFRDVFYLDAQGAVATGRRSRRGKRIGK